MEVNLWNLGIVTLLGIGAVMIDQVYNVYLKLSQMLILGNIYIYVGIYVHVCIYMGIMTYSISIVSHKVPCTKGNYSYCADKKS